MLLNTRLNESDFLARGAKDCGFYNNNIYQDISKECTQGLKNFALDELEVFQVKNF